MTDIKENVESQETKDAAPKKETLFEIFVQFIKFGLVGVSNTIVSWVIYFIINTLLLPESVFKYGFLVASIVSWLISVLWAYVMQNIFVFKEDKNKERRVWWKTLLKTYASYAFTGLFLCNVLLILWTTIDVSQYFGWLFSILNNIHLNGVSEYLAVSSNLGWFIDMIISIPINFLINKFWSYSQKDN